MLTLCIIEERQFEIYSFNSGTIAKDRGDGERNPKADIF
jgi:hypothetical protein